MSRKTKIDLYKAKLEDEEKVFAKKVAFNNLKKQAEIHETLYLLSIPGMYESLKKSLKTPLKKCSKELKW